MSLDNLRLTTLLGFDDLIGLALVVAVGAAVVGGVETFDSELETRRGAVAVLEPGAMALDVLVSKLSSLTKFCRVTRSSLTFAR